MGEKSFKEFIEKIKEEEGYWIEKVVVDFVSELYALMKNKEMTKADLAHKLGTSQAYITKVFRGNANFTIASMVRLARAVGGQVHVHLESQPQEIHWIQNVSEKASLNPVWYQYGRKGTKSHGAAKKAPIHYTENHATPLAA